MTLRSQFKHFEEFLGVSKNLLMNQAAMGITDSLLLWYLLSAMSGEVGDV